MSGKNLLSIVVFIILMSAVGFGGPYLTRRYFNNHKKKINKNGVAGKGVIYRKWEHKGNTLFFEYLFRKEAYKNREPDKTSFFDHVDIGDTVDIVIDSTNPADSYIIKK